MSYCRFSSDDFASDVYVIGVARNEIEIYIATNKNGDSNFHGMAGQHFCRLTKQEALQQLLDLRANSLYIPESAIERLTKELADEKTKGDDERLDADQETDRSE